VIYRNKKEKWTRIFTFWTQEVPQTMYHARKELLVSVLIFLASVLVGIVSAANDDNFVRLILGNGYVDMTLDTERVVSRWLCTTVRKRYLCFWVLL